MRTVAAVVTALWASAAGAAGAADKPVMAPPATWVQPIPLPADDGKADGAPIKLLLTDEQIHFGSDGTTLYSEVALRIQTPQGLAAGSISFPWNPDTDTLTVHKVRIRRAGKVIDVLAAGQTFTVIRRESNLENAVLDGVLTANIQPEGLQVGDVIDFAASLTRNDPALKGHREELVGGWGGIAVAKLHLETSWAGDPAVRWRSGGGAPPLRAHDAGGAHSVELAIDNLKPVVLASDAPARFRMLPQVEFSDFKDWSQVAALMVPLYQKASALPADGKLQGEIARIAAASSDPKARAQAALTLVQDRVRYVFLGMNDGGLVPADAEATWSRRFGDCKGKTALLLALLHGLGVAAEPVIVSSTGGDGLDQRLPMVAPFDHVLVRATIAGRVYWLDGTRTGDTDLDAIRVPGFEWGLPIVANAALVRLVQQPLDRPEDDTRITLDASAGLTVPASAHVEVIYRGDGAMGLNLQLSALDPVSLDQALRKYWKGQYDFIDVKSTSASFDRKTGEEKLVLDGTAKMDWGYSRYETDGSAMGYKANLTRPAGADQNAPYAVAFPSYSRTVETIVLPDGGKGFTISDGAEVTQTIGGTEFRRHATVTGGTATIDTSTRGIADEFPAAQGPAAEKALRDLAKQTVYVVEPVYYTKTKAEVDAAMAETPTTTSEYTTRGNMLMDHDRIDEAIADFDKALALNPKSASALADRGMARIYKGNDAAAQQDFDAAAAVDPRDPVVFRGRGTLAMKKQDYPAAIAAFTRSIELDPDNTYALYNRAAMYRANGDIDRGLADADRVIELQPSLVDAYLLRANIYRFNGDKLHALAQAEAVVKANPDSFYAYTVAGSIYGSYHETAEAMRVFDRSVQLHPSVETYLARMNARPKQDVAGRRADVEAALKIDPHSGQALSGKAKLSEGAGDYKGAIDTLTAALKFAPTDFDLLAQRGMDYARSDQPALAERDYVAARAKAGSPFALNNLCWTKATANVSLASALTDCDAALKSAPDEAGIQDSRGLVLLRLGRTDEAIAQYDKALAKAPTQSSSLYGRAVAEARKGDKDKSAADIAAATKADQNIAERFGDYGIKP